MNRQTKRMLKRQGQLGPDGNPVAPSRAEAQARTRTRPPTGERTSPRQFFKEVRGELRRVAWPSRGEVVRYSSVVLVTLVIITTLVFGLDWGFGKAIAFLFEPAS